MKTTLRLLAFAFLFSAQAQAASQLVCNIVGRIADSNRHVAIKGMAEMDCATLKFDSQTVSGIGNNRVFSAELEGIGAGFHASSASVISITCPTVRSKALGRGVTEFYGLRVEAAVVLGTQVGIFANEKGGICILSGLDMAAIGAAIQGAKLTITER